MFTKEINNQLKTMDDKYSELLCDYDQITFELREMTNRIQQISTSDELHEYFDLRYTMIYEQARIIREIQNWEQPLNKQPIK